MANRNESIYQWKIVEEKKVEKPPRYQPVTRCRAHSRPARGVALFPHPPFCCLLLLLEEKC